jgi:GNAT superfamily N-acetyltransferase
MTAVSIRTAELRDHDEVQAVRQRSALSNEGDREFILANPDTLTYDPTPLAEGRTRVAVIDGRIVGFTTVSGNEELELEALFVEPASMRTGIGRKLVHDVAERARAEGITRINVIANPHALEFYAAVGFVAAGRIATRGGMGLRMYLDLEE